MSITIHNKKYDINLQELNLRYNQLSSLPGEIGNLINLQYLSLNKNKLRSLPRALALRGCFAVRLKLFR